MEENPELNAFRQQWREEVNRRAHSTTTAQVRPTSVPESSTPNSHLDHLPPSKHQAADRKDDAEEEAGLVRDYGEFVQRTEGLSLRSADEDSFHRGPQREPQSALEHFEKAVEKEAAGSLGDSLDHYRKAYRLDAAIDQKYRKKHFSAKPAVTQSAAVTTTDDVVKPNKKEDAETLATPELILSFANSPILPADPFVEGDPAPPCPIAKIPHEIVVEILRHVACMDPASFGRMSLVCKRFAYDFAHEQQIWKRLCQGHEFGFGSMHYSFNCDIEGRPYQSLTSRFTPFPSGSAVSIPKPLSSWMQVFQAFPRIRFTGIYISTVNYTRPGGASSYANAAWNDPIHIVTYYRYLRFYPDGSVISLVTTTEPVDVVPHISKENVAAALLTRQPGKRKTGPALQEAAAAASGAPVPHVAMQALKYALRGRWHLARPHSEEPHSSDDGDRLHAPALSPSTRINPIMGDDPRDVTIETEGVDPKYTYVLHLGLRSSNPTRAAGATKAPPNVSKNTKLAWKGYWSYNKLTDDWGEFTLRNDRSFVFRRVRDWGV